jgi:alkylated DNA repair protein (DNA oxidative demethylase)
MTMDLFDNIVENEPRDVQLAPGAMLLTGFARSFETALIERQAAWSNVRRFAILSRPAATACRWR